MARIYKTLSNIFKSLAYQLAQVDSVFRNFVVGAISKPDTTATPRKLWQNLFLDFYRASRKLPNAAMIVLDGLDEALKKTLTELFATLEVPEEAANLRISWAFISRPE